VTLSETVALGDSSSARPPHPGASRHAAASALEQQSPARLVGTGGDLRITTDCDEALLLGIFKCIYTTATTFLGGLDVR
jgi:hypothetical protein